MPRSVPIAAVPPGGLAGSPAVSGPGAFEAGAGQAPPELQGARGPGDVPAGEWHKAVESWLREVDLLREGDRHELRLRLVPEHLGPLHVELSHEGAGLRARITVGHTETLALIQRHLDDLRQALHEQGYELARVDVGLGPGGNAGHERRGDREPQGQSGGRVAAAGGSEQRAGVPAGDPAGPPGLVAWRPGGTGVLDVRI